MRKILALLLLTLIPLFSHGVCLKMLAYKSSIVEHDKYGNLTNTGWHEDGAIIDINFNAKTFKISSSIINIQLKIVDCTVKSDRVYIEGDYYNWFVLKTINNKGKHIPIIVHIAQQNDVAYVSLYTGEETLVYYTEIIES